jgi:hypothetical protein
MMLVKARQVIKCTVTVCCARLRELWRLLAGNRTAVCSAAAMQRRTTFRRIEVVLRQGTEAPN